MYQGDVTATLITEGTAVVRYTYDAWGKLLTTTGSMASTLGVHNPLRYRAYVYDTETSLYYLQSRYYNPAMSRFINMDIVLYEKSILGSNLFCYCKNSPVMYVDHRGYGTTYVIYYDNPGSGFEEQAFNSPYYDEEDEDVIFIAVTSSNDFIEAWNSMEGEIDYAYLYLHGGEGKLFFKNETLTFSGTQSFADLNDKEIDCGVYLLSCHGGDGKAGNNVALMFSELTSAKTYACTGSVSYSCILGNYYARKAKDFGIIKTFWYQKRFILWGENVAMAIPGQW